jgi:hypothetical protein
LTIYDQAGNIDAKLLSGNFSLHGNYGTNVSNGIITTTSSSGGVYIGANVNFTPQVSTTALALVPGGWISNQTAGDGVQLVIYRNTGTNNPAGGGAASGSFGASINGISTGANQFLPACMAAIDTNLTPGTAYTYSLALVAVSGAGTAAQGITTAFTKPLSVIEI